MFLNFAADGQTLPDYLTDKGQSSDLADFVTLMRRCSKKPPNERPPAFTGIIEALNMIFSQIGDDGSDGLEPKSTNFDNPMFELNDRTGRPREGFKQAI